MKDTFEIYVYCSAAEAWRFQAIGLRPFGAPGIKGLVCMQTDHGSTERMNRVSDEIGLYYFGWCTATSDYPRQHFVCTPRMSFTRWGCHLDDEEPQYLFPEPENENFQHDIQSFSKFKALMLEARTALGVVAAWDGFPYFLPH